MASYKPSIKAYQFSPEIKAVGNLSPYKQRLLHRQIELIRSKHERTMRYNLRTAFNRQLKNLIALDDDPTFYEISDAVLSVNPLLERIYTTMYTRMADDIYPMVETTAKVKSAWQSLEHKSDESLLYYQVLVQQWVEDNCARNIAGINATTMEQIQRAYMGAESMVQFRDDITDIFNNNIKTYRANAIARTETACASNRTELVTIESMDPPKDTVKEWQATTDSLTRETHMHLNGRQVPFDDKWTWTGKYGYVQMDCPGDSTHGAPPAEFINCRCYFTVHV